MVREAGAGVGVGCLWPSDDSIAAVPGDGGSLAPGREHIQFQTMTRKKHDYMVISIISEVIYAAVSF